MTITVKVSVRDNDLSDEQLLHYSHTIATQIKRLGLSTIQLKDNTFSWIGVFENTRNAEITTVRQYLNMVNEDLFRIVINEQE